jgi:hypothetical protein
MKRKQSCISRGINPTIVHRVTLGLVFKIIVDHQKAGPGGAAGWQFSKKAYCSSNDDGGEEGSTTGGGVNAGVAGETSCRELSVIGS